MTAILITRFLTPTPIKVTRLLPDGRVTTLAQISPESIAAVTGAPGMGGNSIVREFSFGDATPDLIATLVIGQYLSAIRIDVLEAFDGLGAEISIGTIGSPESLVRADGSLLSSVGIYEHSRAISGPLSINMFITPGAGASTGRGKITLSII